MSTKATSLLVTACVSLLAVWAVLMFSPPTASAPVLSEGPLPAVVIDTPRALSRADAPLSDDALRDRIQAILQREGVPGVGVALVDRDGLRWAAGIGVADLESERPVTEDSVFRVASITKSVVGMGVMRLHELHALDLDAPLHESLPELSLDNPWREQAPVTLADALEHTAGFDDMHFNEYYVDHDAMGPAEALAINPRSRAIRWRPGSRTSYSNVGYSVAALAIERATGERFDTWLTDEVLRPIGMGTAALVRTPELTERLVTGYLGPEQPARFSPLAHRGAGALLASPVELAQLVHFQLVRGEGYPEVVSPQGQARIERGTTTQLSPTDAAYGLGNYGDVAHPVVGRGHDGGLPGFLSCYRYFPELGVGYVMLLNATHSPRAYKEIRGLLFAQLTAGRTLPPPPSIRPDPARDRHAAFYRFGNPRHSLLGFVERALLGWDVEASDAGMRIAGTLEPPVEVVPTADGAYRVPGQGGSAIRFGHDADGAPVMVAGWAYGEQASRQAATWRVRVLTGAAFLLQLAPVWCVAFVLLRLVRRRSLAGASIVVWPAIAGLCMLAMPALLSAAFGRDALGRVDWTTVALFASTLLFALASAAGLAAALRARRTISLWVRLVPTLTATAAFGLTLWLGAHGIIGLRTWAW